MALSDEQIQKFKAEHGEDLYCFNTEAGDVVLKPPSRAAFKRFVDQDAAGKVARSAGLETLVRDCVVYPERKDVESILDRYPGYLVHFAAKVQELGRAGAELEGKKL
jgi:hypothetical protein